MCRFCATPKPGAEAGTSGSAPRSAFIKQAPETTDPAPRTGSIERLASLPRDLGRHGGLNPAVEASTTFAVQHAGTMPEIFAGRTEGCYLYSRHFNPTVLELGKQLAAIENTEAAYCTSSGLAAISCALMGLCNSGDHIVASDTLYGGTYALLAEFFPKKLGITCTFVNVKDVRAVSAAIVQGKTKVVYCESLSNPTLRLADLPALAAVAHASDCGLVVDNTFAPLVMTPADHGADVVVHSLTKFINGASDIVAGCICGTTAFIASLMDLHCGSLMLMGPTMDPHVASTIALRLPHLSLRMAAHAQRAQLLAERLRAAGVAVVYPGLQEHPDYALLRRLASDFDAYGGGGVLTIDAGSRKVADEFMNDLQNTEHFGHVAVSLGYFDTLMSCSAASTSSELGDEALVRSGIKPGLVRVSVGFTGSDRQRWHQLLAALERVGLVAPELQDR